MQMTSHKKGSNRTALPNLPNKMHKIWHDDSQLSAEVFLKNNNT